jgi:hypothetical protein
MLLHPKVLLGAEGASEEALDRFLIENPPLEKRINHDGHFVRPERPFHPLDANEEMTWKSDPVGRDANATRDLAINDGQSDRNAQLAFEDVGQEAVSWIVVVALVASEAERSVNVLPQETYLLERLLLLEPLPKEGCRDFIEPRKEGTGVHTRINIPRHQSGT